MSVNILPEIKASDYLIRLLLVLIFTCSGFQLLKAQKLEGKALADSLIQELPKTKTDTSYVNIMISIAKALVDSDPAIAMKYADSAMQLAQQQEWKKGIALAYLCKARIYRTTSDYITGLKNANRSYEIFDSLKWKKGIANADVEIANIYGGLGNYSKAIENNFKALGIYEELNMEEAAGTLYNNIGNDYYALDNYPKAIENYKKSLELVKKTNNKFAIASALDNMASAYEGEGEFKNVNDYNLQAIQLFKEIDDKPALGRIYNNRGNIFGDQMKFDSAIFYYKKAIAIAENLNIKSTIAYGYFGMGDAYRLMAKGDSGKYTISDSLKTGKDALLKKSYSCYSTALALAEKMGDLSLLMTITKSLSETEALLGNYKAALDFYTRSTEYKDSIFNNESQTKIAALENERLTEVKNKEIQLLNKENALQSAHSKLIYSILGTVVLAIVIIAVIQFRSNKHKQKANIALQQEKQKVENTLQELKSTQAQLIQSEKMASLGELTAGIAHEIQNPLNFVNNFSEVNKELISELVDEVDKGNTEEVKTIANDIKENEEKINHHGKRADAIVKGMLQHSRQTKGVKEPTNINALCDEYLRLSYHGLRAKDKSFNAEIKTDFDESIGKINIVPQDIGRVLLNLFNNAFYAVNEKSQQSTVNSPQPLSHEYKPLVFIQTKKLNDKVEIVVSDNGNGIPQNIIDKIFQPFFTTKPTGEGTGLGLSLAYDIIAKEHNGTIKVESKEGEGTKFIILLQ